MGSSLFDFFTARQKARTVKPSQMPPLHQAHGSSGNLEGLDSEDQAETDGTANPVDTTDRLCHDCQNIDDIIQSAFKEWEKNPRRIDSDGSEHSLDHVSQRSSCRLCRFLFCARTPLEGNTTPEPTYELHMLPAKNKLQLGGIDYLGIPEFEFNDSPACVVLPSGYQERLYMGNPGPEPAGIILPLTGHLNGISGRAVHPRVDISVVKEWLNFCDVTHGAICGGVSDPMPAGFRVIDCSTRCLVLGETLHNSQHYLTLSYVWGGTGAGENEPPNTNNEIPKTLPHTIEDSILLTLRLGYRYLWIDRYCIPQDHAIKESQIQAMDSVYRNSALTIIAAAGNNPHYGLPGISTRLREPYPSITLGSHHLVFAPYAKRDTYGSTWGARGWTYQEGLLARRKLVFTDKTVYFQCSGMHAIESISVPLTKITEFRDQKLTKRADISRVFPYGGISDMEMYARIGEYMPRKFTFESDALNAFRGVLSASERASGCRSLLGLPLMSPQRYPRHAALIRLIDSLAWDISGVVLGTQPQGLERRRLFPSWTWLGWRVQGPASIGRGHYLKSRVPVVEVQVEFVDGTRVVWNSETAEGILDRAKHGESYAFLLIQGPTLSARISQQGHFEGINGSDDGAGILKFIREPYDVVWVPFGIPEEMETVELTLVVLAIERQRRERLSDGWGYLRTVTILVLYQPEGAKHFERVRVLTIAPSHDENRRWNTEGSVDMKGWERRTVRVG
ncbi:heterokaryon incompatibility protein-domain-containing protein [Echria macrotheca]|uniref:Heterokaryon incompatibility protein-domain-containing protein n=1 Tax=Echria macrotheca TaxID=438768 RepID=A0AAJ0B502_9PEZI|nr:heterokaryon incompatibility protein-domain-containing protein [Echria macrotheca]